MITAILFCRRADREPNPNDRLCGCHFPNGRDDGPSVFQWSKTTTHSHPTSSSSSSPGDHTYCKVVMDPNRGITGKRIQEQEDMVEMDLDPEDEAVAQDSRPFASTLSRPPLYPPAGLSDEVIRMETGLPDKAMFRRVVGLVERFEGSIVYAAGWTGESITIECQVFMALMKLHQNYTNLHLAQLFCCSSTTVANVVKTMIHLLHKVLFSKMMATVPSLQKNRESMPASFVPSASNCRMIIDCTDFKVDAPKDMDKAKLMYSAYRGMHSCKALIGVAPNGVITYCSPLFLGSTSDKAITAQCGLLEHLEAGDMIMADKGFLISDLLPEGVSVNIPPFLNKGKFSESEVRATRVVARNRIHVERANAWIKDFRILNKIPTHLRGCATVLVQLCCALVNLQHPLIKETSSSLSGCSSSHTPTPL